MQPAVTWLSRGDPAGTARVWIKSQQQQGCVWQIGQDKFDRGAGENHHRPLMAHTSEPSLRRTSAGKGAGDRPRRCSRSPARHSIVTLTPDSGSSLDLNAEA